jgi:hypothetical protein
MAYFKASDVEAWRVPADLGELEAALDVGRLHVRMNHGAWWIVRRNGKTRRWARTPERWRVPIRVGLHETGAAEPYNLSIFRIRPQGAKSAPLAGFSRPTLPPLPGDA